VPGFFLSLSLSVSRGIPDQTSDENKINGRDHSCMNVIDSWDDRPVERDDYSLTDYSMNLVRIFTRILVCCCWGL
jgi:hypothetical protein